ncbi:MAG: c-type cytochrome [Parvularculaceae bacterium]|nr:c-type cytochrome [Parvularculaceae bacterium]
MFDIRLGAVFGAIALAGCGGADTANEGTVRHAGDAAVGRAAFVQKGCVLCHSVNGVGGKAAPALDAADDFVKPDPVEFAARMWRGAAAMVEFQSVELGYVIDLTADDIANIAAFAASRDAQKLLNEGDIPAPMRDSILDERYWEMEDWSDFMATGREGYETTEPDGAGEQR